MPFIRLSDNYIDHPKFTNLSDGAFRLWHEGMAFSRRHQTDGLIPVASARAFKSYSPKRTKILLTPWQAGASALWSDVPGFGFLIHDYLEWNLSKEEEQSGRDAARDRMRRLRGRSGVGSREQQGERSADVPDRIGKDLEKPEKRKPPHARSGRPIFDGQRFVVFEWQLDELVKMLGAHVEAFDLHEWFYTADAKALTLPIRDRREWWPWLQQETILEAARRGLPVAVAGAEDAAFAAIIAKGPSVRP